MVAMNLPNFEFFLILGSAVVLVFFLALAAATFSAWRGVTRWHTEAMTTQNQALLERLNELHACHEATDQRIAQLIEQLEQPMARMANGSTGPQGYQIAIRLARSGANTEELISGCGLTRAEAELVRRLHGPALPELRQAS